MSDNGKPGLILAFGSIFSNILAWLGAVDWAQVSGFVFAVYGAAQFYDHCIQKQYVFRAKRKITTTITYIKFLTRRK